MNDNLQTTLRNTFFVVVEKIENNNFLGTTFSFFNVNLLDREVSFDRHLLYSLFLNYSVVLF